MTANGTEQNEHQTTETFTEGDPLQPNGVTESVKRKRTCCETFKLGVKNITVEPILSLFIVGAIVNNLTVQNLSLDKACRVNLNFSKEICDSLRLQEIGSQNEYEREVQRLIARFISYKTYITATIPSLITLFAGAFSDQTGRKKIFLLVPLTGQILMSINNILNTYFFYELNLEFLTFSEAVLDGFSGSWSVLMFIVFSYISVITSAKTRTFRMGLLNFALTVGFPIGMGLSGILMKKFGFYGGFGLSLICHIINVIYTIIVLKEPTRTPEQKEHDNRGFRRTIKTFFSYTNVVASLNVMFKGPSKRRWRLILYMFVICALFGPMYGEISVLYLSTRYRFNWDELQFSIFQTYNFIIHTIGTIFSITVFSKLLGWHDSILGIISTVSKIAAAFVYAFAVEGRILYIAPLVDILNGTAMLAMRSIISKFVEIDELGRVNSIISLTENLMPLLFIPLYTNVYKNTMEVLPGAVFLLGAAITLPAVFVFIYLFVEHLRGRHKNNEKDQLKPKLSIRESDLLQPN